MTFAFAYERYMNLQVLVLLQNVSISILLKELHLINILLVHKDTHVQNNGSDLV